MLINILLLSMYFYPCGMKRCLINITRPYIRFNNVNKILFINCDLFLVKVSIEMVNSIKFLRFIYF